MSQEGGDYQLGGLGAHHYHLTNKSREAESRPATERQPAGIQLALQWSRSQTHGTPVQGQLPIGRPRHGTARHGTARHGTARHGTVRHGTARHGTPRHGTARPRQVDKRSSVKS